MPRCSVSNHQPRATQAPALDVPEHLGPVLSGLPVSGNSAHHHLAPVAQGRHHHQYRRLLLLKTSLDVDLHPPTCRPLPGHRGGRLRHWASSSFHLSSNRATVLADTGASSPSSPRKARSKSPSDRPCRYSSGINSATFLVLLTNSGSSRLSNCSSVPRTRGRLSCIVPELSVSLRALPYPFR